MSRCKPGSFCWGRILRSEGRDNRIQYGEMSNALRIKMEPLQVPHPLKDLPQAFIRTGFPAV